ncbi:MAG: hypothetical protein UY62_C0005G0015 [Parcubacteria group bacterium GW2011_GWF2_50_9]|nr:MAG: hypothetical protein UY62_C0005G0015 [Parcubacteria group bacterium GW2011_GWF2_50_9]
MNFYQDLIIKATGANKADAEYIEDIMRNDIFHSTLDWQSRTQLARAAKDAAGLLVEYHEAGLFPPLS